MLWGLIILFGVIFVQVLMIGICFSNLILDIKECDITYNIDKKNKIDIKNLKFSIDVYIFRKIKIFSIKIHENYCEILKIKIHLNVLKKLKDDKQSGIIFIIKNIGRLEPEIKFFRFAKSDSCFEDLTEEQKQEEIMNLRNGFNYGRKVVSTGACDMVILDEILGVLDEGVISADEIRELCVGKPEDMTLICTGRVLEDSIREYADEIYNIAPEK